MLFTSTTVKVFYTGFQGYKTCGLPSRAVEQTLKYVVPQKNCQLAEQNNTFIGKKSQSFFSISKMLIRIIVHLFRSICFSAKKNK